MLDKLFDRDFRKRFSFWLSKGAVFKFNFLKYLILERRINTNAMTVEFFMVSSEIQWSDKRAIFLNLII